jgi:hypothetical protein
MKPGIRYIPSQFSSFPPASVFGRFSLDGYARITHSLNFLYAIIFDHDIDRPNWGRTGTIDEGNAPNDKLCERAIALFYQECFFDFLLKQR